MVGARRPSVTTALGQLIAREEIERRADGELAAARPAAGADPLAVRRPRGDALRFERERAVRATR